MRTHDSAHKKDDFLARYPGLIATVITIAIGLIFIGALVSSGGH